MKKFISFYIIFLFSISLWANSNIELNLSKGWNLISTPVDKNISDFSIFDNFKLIWNYRDDNWIKNPNYIESGEGFWVNMEQNKSLYFSGESYNISKKIFNLESEWNLLGSAKEFKNKLFNTIWNYKNNKWIKNPKSIQRGDGFWIKNYDRDETLGVLKEDEEIIPKVDTYSLPIISMDEILNFERDIEQKFGINLSQDAKDKLLKNGFVVIPSEFNRFKDAYDKLKSTGETKYSYYYLDEEIEPDSATPIYVTVDSIMHLYHIYFQETLKYIEINYFVNDLKVLIDALIEHHKNYNFSDIKLQNAQRLNLAYLSVAMKLLNPEYELLSSVKDIVDKELQKIFNTSKIEASEIFTNNCPFDKEKMCGENNNTDSMFFGELGRTQECYCEDFTQYIPRGHYTINEELQRYFKAMMYLSRMSFLTKYDRPTIGATLLSDALNSATTSENQKALYLWNKIYKVTSFFIGTSDDLLPYEYNSAFMQTFGEDAKFTELSENMDKFIEKLNELRDPSILGGFKNALLDTSTETKGLRLMGRRFIPDSYVFSESVGENAGIFDAHPQKDIILKYAEDNYGYLKECQNLVDKNPLEFGNEEMACACSAANYLKYPDFCRNLPSGLDLMTIMNSSLAKEIQQKRDYKYVKLEGTHKRLKSEFESYTLKDFSQSSYWGWLYMLQPLIKDFNEGYPIYMQSSAWRELMLNSSLASWSELRHDTILYAKQSYTEYAFMTTSAMPQKPIEPKYYGYVEPIPEFYKRALNLTEMMIEGLNKFDLRDIAKSLNSGKDIMDRLYDISTKELKDEELSEDDYDYIKSISDTFSDAIDSLAKSVTKTEGSCSNTPGMGCLTSTDMVGDPYETRVVADVHTDPNSKKVLEVATAEVDYLIVVRKVSNGTLGASIGPVFSYREFAHPMDERLTDEKWRELLEKDADINIPEWINYRAVP